MKRNGKPRGSTNSKPIEVMMGRLVIRRSAPSMTLGPSAEDIMQSKQVTSLTPGSQHVPDIGKQVLSAVALGAVGSGEETGGGGATGALEGAKSALVKSALTTEPEMYAGQRPRRY